MNFGSDDGAEYARPVAVARDQFKHALSGFDLGEIHHCRHLAPVVIDCIGLALRIVDRSEHIASFHGVLRQLRGR